MKHGHYEYWYAVVSYCKPDDTSEVARIIDYLNASKCYKRDRSFWNGLVCPV